MVTLVIFIMLLNVHISVHIHVNQELIVSFTSIVCFLTIASRPLTCMIKTFYLHENSLIKQIIYEFFVLESCFF